MWDVVGNIPGMQEMRGQLMQYFHSWSGGKDSTAAIILDHENGLPPSKIVFSEVMFDIKRDISGEMPEHIDFITKTAKPLFEKWGYEVEIVRADIDYIDGFFHVRRNSKIPERNGKFRSWPIGGMCWVNSDLKTGPIRKFYKRLGLARTEYTQYVGVAIDEPERLERLKGTNKVSLLAEFGYTEKMAYDLCEKYNLLSPIYKISKRGGCWFCPNQGYAQLAYIKTTHPELWAELKELNKEKNVVSRRFKYGKTLEEVEDLIEEEIRRQFFAAQQQSLFI